MCYKIFCTRAHVLIPEPGSEASCAFAPSSFWVVENLIFLGGLKVIFWVFENMIFWVVGIVIFVTGALRR